MMQQIPLPLPHNAAMGADDFLVTPCNQEAAAWIEKWPDWPTLGVVVVGAAGSGKTHLLHWWLAKTGGKIISLKSLAEQDFSTLIEQATAFAIDDADKIAGIAEAEEKMFHLFNHLKTTKGSLLLSLSIGTGQAGFVLPDLRSRLLTLPIAPLLAPDDALLEALLIKQFRDRQIDLDAGVVTYLTPRMPRDAAGVRALVKKLDLASLAMGRKISVALARAVLEDTHE